MKRKSISTNAVYSLSAKVVAMLVPLLVLPYIMRTLGAESYGKVIYAEAIVSYFIMFARLGISNYAQRECSVLRDNKELLSRKVSQIFALSFIMTMASFAVFLLCIVFVKPFGEEKELFYIFSLMIISSGLLLDWLYEVQERFDLNSKREILAKLFYIALSFICIKNSGDYKKYAFIIVFTTSLFQMIWNYIRIGRGECDVKPDFRNARHIGECVKPVFYLAMLTLGSKLFTDSDVIMIKWFTSQDSDAAVGLYNSAIILPKALDTLLMAVAAVITPQLYIAVKSNKNDTVHHLINHTSNVLFFICTPAIVGCLFFSRDIMLLFAGEEFLPAAPVLKTYCFVMLFVLMITLAGTRMYVARGKERKLFVILLAGATLNILLNYFFIKKNGIYGAATATLLSYIIVTVVELALEKTWPFLFTTDKIKYVISAAAMSLSFLLIRSHLHYQPAVNLGVAAVIGGAVYLATMLLTKESTLVTLSGKIKRIKS